MTDRSGRPRHQEHDWGKAPYAEAFAAGQRDMRAHFQQVPPDPHYVYVRKSSDKDSDRDVQVGQTGVWMDYKTLAGVVIALGVLMWNFNSIQWELKELRELITNQPAQYAASLKVVADGLNDRIARVEAELVNRTASRWTKADHELFCARTEQINPNWKCGNHIVNGGVMGQDLDTTPPSWSTTAKRFRKN